MWVFVDDSGDCGFKFDDNSSRMVVMAAVVFRERGHMVEAMKYVEDARINTAPDGSTYRLSREFKYSGCKATHKDRFFEAVRPADFSVRVIALDKRDIRSEYLRANPGNLKSYLIMQMLTHTYGRVSGAKLVVDGEDTRSFNMTDREYFMRRVNQICPGTLAEVEFADSKRNDLVQLADMIAGSSRQHLEGNAVGRIHFSTYRRRTWQPHGSVWRFR